MKHSKKSLQDFAKNSKVLKIQKTEKSKIKGGIIDTDLDNI